MIPSQHVRSFRILSIDGGGIRGAFAAAFLARIENEIGAPITDYFDLVVGTSTGGIIALALALGESAERIRRMYEEKGAAIFMPRVNQPAPLWVRFCLGLLRKQLPGVDDRMLFRSKYSDEQLVNALVEVYGDRTLESATTTRVAIPAIDLTYGQTIVFKTPHRPNFVRDRKYKAVDVALATAAAPAYFPPAGIDKGRFADGGLWANNPCIVGFVEAVKISRDCRRPGLDPEFEIDDISMLSIGTGEPEYYAKPAPGDDGLIWWGPRLFDVATGAQAQGTHFQIEYLLGAQRYLRIDFKMPKEPWRLDDVSALDELLHYGEKKAVEHLAALKRGLLAQTKQAYVPFE